MRNNNRQRGQSAHGIECGDASLGTVIVHAGFARPPKVGYDEAAKVYNEKGKLMQERLQKILAQAGFGSRRACEEFIIAGRVRVNGQTAELGQKADLATDRVTLDGKPLPKVEQLVYIALNKPRYVLSTVEGEQEDNRETVRDLVDVAERVYPVGRLDLESEGLVLMTNDGDLANRLTHPRYGHQKEYKVLVARRPDEEQLTAWRRGVMLEDGYKTAPAGVNIVETKGKGAWLRVVMGEGRKRQIREIGSLLGLPVVRILRVRIASLRLGPLRSRAWRYLTAEEVRELKNPSGVSRIANPTSRSRKMPRTGKSIQKKKRPAR
jgi:23S rRNA pseudouridine2605 synthase